MSRWRTRDDAALSGADCLLRAFDDEVRRFNGAGHLAQLVLRLGPGFDLDAFRTLIDALARVTPILRAPIRRRFGIGAPVYRLSRAARVPTPRITVQDAPPSTAARDWGDLGLPLRFGELLNTRFAIEHGELLRFDVVRYRGEGQGADLAMTWAHMLFDGAGSESFVRRIDECFRGSRAVADMLERDVPDPTRFDGTFAEQARQARVWQERMAAFETAPPRSFGGPRRHLPQALAYEVVTLSRGETAVIERRAASLAGPLTPVPFYLAATVRAHDAVFASRGERPPHYLVPVPVNLRPKGGDGAVFRTNISLLWFHIAREQVGDLPGLVAEILRQRRANIRDGFIQGALASMDLVRAAPTRMLSALARRHLGGELASFFFAFTNEFLPGMETFFGAGIVNGFHVPAVMPSPGSSVIMSIREGRLNVAFIYQRGVISDDERDTLRVRLLDDLLGEAHGVQQTGSSS